MATNTYILDKIKTEDGVVDLLAKSDGANVEVLYPVATGDENTPPEKKLLNRAISDILGDVDTKISNAINGLIDGAPGTYDTLKEISDYITEKGQGDIVTTLNAAIGKKVDKVKDKGLSTNDFTNELKIKLDGITANATKVESCITNGKIKINGAETLVYELPKSTAKNATLVKMSSDANGRVTIGGAVTKEDITGLGIPTQDTTYPVATINSSGLMSKDDKIRLNGIATGATKVEASDTNGKIKINGTATNVYTHPTAPTATAAETKLMKVVGKDATGHVKISGEVTKADINALGVLGVRIGTSVPDNMQVGELFVKQITS